MKLGERNLPDAVRAASRTAALSAQASPQSGVHQKSLFLPGFQQWMDVPQESSR